MNRIHMELVQTIYDYGEYYWMIDGRPIVRYLNEAVSAGACPRLEVFGSLEGLLPAWTGELVWKAENRFIWEMVDSAEDLNVPVLVCEDDCDLSCIVIMAKIRKEPGTVYWDSLGAEFGKPGFPDGEAVWYPVPGSIFGPGLGGIWGQHSM